MKSIRFSVQILSIGRNNYRIFLNFQTKFLLHITFLVNKVTAKKCIKYINSPDSDRILLDVRIGKYDVQPHANRIQ